MLNIDFKNAFSLVDRQPFTKEVKTELPSMYNWVVYCNGNESLLDYDGSTIHSFRGVQQGDLLGPFFFALILNTLVAKINASLGIHIGFFNNGTLIGCRSDLLKALDILSTDGNWSGFEVNFEKCELFYPNQSELSDFPGNLKRLSSAGVDLLGSYIGCPESRERSLEKKTLSATVLLEKLPDFDASQIEFAILKNCLGVCKITHLLRSLRPIPSHSLQFFDQHLCVCFPIAISSPSDI